jgi:hypothetical protein
MSTIASIKRSSVRYGHMEQRLFIQISRQNSLQFKRICLKLPELYGDDALSYSAVCHWSREFLMDRKSVEDARRTGRPPDFMSSFELRAHSMQCLFLMHCRGHAHLYDNRVLHFDKSTRPEIPSLAVGVPLALRRSNSRQGTTELMLLVALTAAEKQRGSNLWTGDESWILWVNLPTGS